MGVVTGMGASTRVCARNTARQRALLTYQERCLAGFLGEEGVAEIEGPKTVAKSEAVSNSL